MHRCQGNRPPPSNPGFYALRYRVYIEPKTVTRFELDGKKVWEYDSEYLGGAVKIEPGRQTLTFNVSPPVNKLTLQFIIQGDENGNSPAEIKTCKAESMKK